ncbi:TonB-dependent receptor [Chryseolinea sp. Jin1]|uniref:TonB-dependent receptor n=2 Tax=Chryseolinea lacunae TaxID=2801331 RepID=A0ABS1L1A6_9BACT|nr:TonB-dependent receptor [Chryseolinea lacunae]
MNTAAKQKTRGEQVFTGNGNYSLQEALFAIESTYQVTFNYDNSLVKDLALHEKFTPEKKEKLEHALERVLKSLNLAYKKVDDKTYLILPKDERQSQTRGVASPLDNSADIHDTVASLTGNYYSSTQAVVEKIVSGTVTDETSQPLPGVNVLVKGSSQGTTTDSNGKFTLSVLDDNATLVFTFIGYVPQEVAVGSQSTFAIQLQPDVTSLSEVVVVGYGTQNRNDVTSSIASVSPSKDLKDMPVSNAAVALQGKVPGVVVQQTSGSPGSTPAIKVRGFGSISAGTSPLIVLDGNIVSSTIFSLLNASDIESIDVLKDASATAIYGSRGANGVLLVSTKRGKSGAVNVTFDAYAGVQQITKKLQVLNAQQFAEFSKDGSNNAYLDNVPGANINDPNSVRPASYLRYRYPRGDLYDWFNFDDPAKVAALPSHNFQDDIFRSAAMSNYQLGVSGGTDKAQFSVSGGYLKQDGIIEKSSLDRYTLRANLDINVTSKLKVGVNINPSYKVQQEVNSDGHWANNGIINAALSAVPMAPIYAADGVTYSSQTELAAAYNWPGITNPIANIKEYNSKYATTTVLANAYAEYKFLNNFKYRVSGNVNFIGNRRNAFRTSKMPLNQQLPPTAAQGTATSDQSINWLVNQVVSYTKTFNDAHLVDALVGMEAYRYQYDYSSSTSINFANDIVQTLNAGTPSTATSNQSANAVASYFARVNYSYRGKYLANVSVRRDGSSIFGQNNRWGTFPAGSLGWRLSEESFMKSITALSEAKLRVSYGLSGNNAFTSSYPYVASLASDNYSYNNTLASGLAPSSLGNSNLGWEKSRQLDAGVDIGLFQDRIFLTVDYYHRNTNGLLLSVNVPSVTGFTTAVKNIGEMENKGWEFGLTTHNLTGALTWTTNGNISFNRNKVLALGPTGDPIYSDSGIGGTNITMIGQPIGNFFGYKQLGIFQTKEEITAYLPNDPNTTSHPGDVKYEDINRDGKITADDRTLIGNNQPKFIFGFTNTFTFKGFDLNIALQGVYGNKILNLSRRFFDNEEGSANNLAIVANRWRSVDQPGDGVTPRANERTTGNNSAVSSRWVEDGSYLRIQNISLGYQLPSSLVEKLHVQRARIYVSTQNLHTWSKYLGYNPEVSGYENPLTSGVDYGSYPLAKTFTVGVNLGF